MYNIINTQITIEGQKYDTYGLQCGTMHAADVTADKTAALNLAEKFNKYQLSSIQLYDAVEDYLDM